MNYSIDEINRLSIGIYNGDISPENLPIGLYKSIGNHLVTAIENGSGVNFAGFEFGSIGQDMAYNLRENVFLFAGAKTFNYVLSTKNLIIDESGKIIPLREFQKIAEENFNLYNKTWLQTEWATAQISSANIVDELKFKEMADFFPLLKYNTVHDSNVSEVCKQLDGIVKPVEDPFWKKFSPQNHFNCRCFKVPLEDGAETNTANKNFIEPKGIFNQNPAESGKIFTSNHPYFDVPKQYKSYAKNNFNLPLPSKPEFISFVEASTVKEVKVKVKDLFSKETVLNITDISISKKLDIEQLNRRVGQLDSLLKEYKFNPALVPGEVKVLFSGSSGHNGAVRYYPNKPQYASIDFGSNTASALERGSEINRILSKSKVNSVNFDIATLTHEFAHCIATSAHTKVSGIDVKSFFTELQLIRKDYLNEKTQYFIDKDSEGLIKISLGTYADKNIDEFLAEGFTEYKLRSNPSKYAVLIGKLVDKYFKK